MSLKNKFLVYGISLPKLDLSKLEKIRERYLALKQTAKREKININFLLSPQVVKTLEKVSNFTVKNRQIVLVGSVGVGKSTFISAILGLLYVTEKGRIGTVLPTGSGRTTIGDFRIVQSDSDLFKVKVIPFSKSEFNEILRDFLSFMKNYVEGTIKEKSELPLEIINYLNRQIGLLVHSKREEREQVYKNYINLPLSEALSRLEKAVQFEKRIALFETSIEINIKEPTDRFEKFKYLSKLLKAINLGNSLNGVVFPMPKEVILQIPKSLVNLNGWEILDTKGIEGERFISKNSPISYIPRIQSKLEDSGNFIILCSSFVDAPSKYILTLLENFREVYGEEKFEEFLSRSMLVLLAKGDELFLDEEDETYEINKKLFEVQSKFLAEQMPEPTTIVFNSIGGKRAGDYEYATPPSVFWNILNQKVIEYEKTQFALTEKELELLDKLLKEFQKIITENSVFFRKSSKKVKELIQDLSQTIKEKVVDELLFELIENYIRTIVREYSASTVRALHRPIPQRKGIYLRRDLDIYEQVFYYLVFKKLKKDVIPSFRRFNSEIKTLALLSDKFEKDVVEQVAEVITKRVKDFIVSLFKTGAYRTKDFLQENENFWIKIEEEYGRGAGYTDRVINHWKDEIPMITYVYRNALLKKIETLQGLLNFLDDKNNKKTINLPTYNGNISKGSFGSSSLLGRSSVSRIGK